MRLPQGTVLGELRIREVLVDFDGPQLFACTSSMGGVYLVVHAEEAEHSDTWLYVPTTNVAIGKLKRGEMSIRTALVRNGTGIGFLATFDSLSSRWTVETRRTDQLEDNLLPDPAEYLTPERRTQVSVPDLFLDKASTTPTVFRAETWDVRTPTKMWEVDREVIDFFKEIKTPVQRAATLGGVHVLDLRLFRTASESRIDVPSQTLGRVLSQMQALVDACGEARLDRAKTAGPVKAEVRERTKLVAEAVFAGSFGIRLGSETRELDLEDKVKSTFRDVVSLIDATTDLVKVRRLLKGLGPRVTIALKAVARTLKKERLSLAVELGVPGLGRALKGSLLRRDLTALLRLLNRITSTKDRTIEVEGDLVAVNMRTHTFSIMTDEETFTGRIDPACVARVDQKKINASHKALIDVFVELNESSGEAEERYVLVDIEPIE